MWMSIGFLLLLAKYAISNALDNPARPGLLRAETTYIPNGLPKRPQKVRSNTFNTFSVQGGSLSATTIYADYIILSKKPKENDHTPTGIYHVISANTARALHFNTIQPLLLLDPFYASKINYFKTKYFVWVASNTHVDAGRMTIITSYSLGIKSIRRTGDLTVNDHKINLVQVYVTPMLVNIRKGFWICMEDKELITQLLKQPSIPALAVAGPLTKATIHETPQDVQLPETLKGAKGISLTTQNGNVWRIVAHGNGLKEEEIKEIQAAVGPLAKTDFFKMVKDVLYVVTYDPKDPRLQLSEGLIAKDKYVRADMQHIELKIAKEIGDITISFSCIYTCVADSYSTKDAAQTYNHLVEENDNLVDLYPLDQFWLRYGELYLLVGTEHFDDDDDDVANRIEFSNVDYVSKHVDLSEINSLSLVLNGKKFGALQNTLNKNISVPKLDLEISESGDVVVTAEYKDDEGRQACNTLYNKLKLLTN